jgi:glutamine amidotransferase
MARIGVIDYGAGNFSSVCNALNHLRLDVIEVRHGTQFEMATHLILPGVGAFAPAMRRLEQLNLIGALKEHVVLRRKPFLGICVGMQVLASLGREFEEHPGLGFIEGTVDRIDGDGHGLRLPHIGWNDVTPVRSSPIFARMNGAPTFYFVHSYHLVPKKRSVILATCEYGTEVVSAVEQDNIYGVQFHPEKSQHDGLQLLKNFALT